MPRLGLGAKRQGRARACRILFKEKAFATQSVRRPWGPPQDLARIAPVAIEICLAEGKPTAQRQNGLRRPLSQARALRVESPGGFGRPGRLQPGRLQRLVRQPGRHGIAWDSLRGTREAPGTQERTNWTAKEAPGKD